MSAGYGLPHTGSSAANPNRHTPQKQTKRSRKVTAPVGVELPDEGLRSAKRMAYRFARTWEGRFAHTPGHGWLEFNGAYWEECGLSTAWNAVHSVCRLALEELATMDRPDWRDALYADVRQCDTAAGTEGVLKHAQHWPRIGIRDEELDTHADLFVCANGTYDLRRGEFRASSPADLMTLASRVDYSPDATCPLYDELLELYQPEPEMRAYLHRLGGAAMEGRQNLQQLIINYGSTGGNGKGTVQRAWMHVFGSYSHVLPVAALLSRQGYDQYRDEKSKLQGRRLVYVTEPSPGQRFDAGTVNSITGGDAVTSRAVYKSSVTFPPTWLILMSTNNRVSTMGNGGMARRVKEIGWTYTVPPGQARTDLDDRLRAEGAGILNRLIAGWLDFRDGGIREPESVTAATTEYLAAVDPIARFLEESVQEMPGHSVTSAGIYQAYTKWCADNGERELSMRLFSPELERLGLAKTRRGSGFHWLGIGLSASEDEQPW